MWFAGLLIGGLIGSLGGVASGFFGALVGAIAGAVIGIGLKPGGRNDAFSSQLAEIDVKIAHIYKSLEDIHRRLVHLERPGEPAEAPAPAPFPIAPSAFAASVQPLSTATDNIGRQVLPPVATVAPPPVAAVAAEPAMPAPPAVEPLPTPVQPATRPSPFEGEATSSAPFIFTAPSWWQRLFAGNIVAKVGALILFFGTCFLLKFAYDHTVLPVPVRLFGVALVGCAMVFGGWRLLARRRLFGLILQGAGIGVLYIDVFFALKVFALIHPTVGFALFMVLGVAATMLAVKQDAKVLAVLGLAGAFLAPVLAGSREGNHVLLFSYYTLLNGFILAISWFKAWRDLNLVGFIFTFIAGVFWGAQSYRPELFGTVEPFVLIFFAMYLVIPILFATRQPPELKGVVDGTLVFGTPLSAAFMQAGLVRDMPYGLAWSAGCAAGLYAVLAISVLRRPAMRLLGETYVALAVIFATMAVFFALDAYPTFALWTLEGAAIVWVGLRQRRLLARLFGITLQFAGALLFLLHYADYSLDNPWFNDFLLGCALIAVAGMITSWLMHKHREVLIEGGEGAAAVLLVWACGWWFVGGLHALHDALPYGDFQPAALIFAAGSFALAETAGGWLDWKTLRLITLVHVPALVLGMLTIGVRHPLAGLGAVAWPVNFLVFFWCIHWQAQDDITTIRGLRYRAGWLLLAILATWEGMWLIDHRYYGWSLLLGVLGIAAGWLRYHLRERDNPDAGNLSTWALLWGLAFWFASGWCFIDQRLPAYLHIACGLGFVAASCALFEIFGGWLRWNSLRRVQLLLLPVMMFTVLVFLERHLHPAADDAWLAWLAAFAAFYSILYRQQKDGIAVGANNQHVFGLWLATGLAAWELAWQSGNLDPATSWPLAIWGAVPALTLMLISHYGRKLWPWGQNFEFFRNMGLTPIALYCVLWSVMSSWDPVYSGSFPYLPLLNPIDLAQFSVLCGLRAWSNAGEKPLRDGESDYSMFAAALGFIWLNAILLRSIHHWAGVPYVAHELFNSIVVQAAFSLLWTLTAMAMMVAARRSFNRKLWFVGAGLLAVVVGKLFLLDLANSGTVARIVSFLGVGGLLMIIGYVAPVPPGDIEKQQG
ncbi:MAG: DUF2339 domain-containing protein [Burkholderiales bacterium]